ncbi:MAG: ATP synthase subunit beta, partial [Parcubacteria group bacterium GW2011_GWC2_42_6]
MNKNTNKTGEIKQIIGPVVDVYFDGELPEIYSALWTKKQSGETVVLEVEQQLPGNIVRTVAMGATDGLRRGMTVNASGKGISVPVGAGTLGRIMDVLGRPIDDAGDIPCEERREIHQNA